MVEMETENGNRNGKLLTKKYGGTSALLHVLTDLSSQSMKVTLGPF